VGSLSSLATSAGTIPAGAAMVTEAGPAPGAPAQNFVFTGPGTQNYQSKISCSGGTAGSGAYTSTATLTASNGQQITQSATVQKQCYDLHVTVASTSAPHVGRWGWSVAQTASQSALTLKPDQKAFAGSSALSFGRDYATTTTDDVIYTVTYRRTAPSGLVSGSPAFEASGEVVVQNPAPINARLQGVYISVSNSRGGAPYTTAASCPVLTIPAGQRITCQWKATPSFNPVGEQVRANARYINTHNGEASASTTDFNSAPATIGGGDDATAVAHRRLQQTWGGRAVGATPEILPSTVGTIYSVNGAPIVVPGAVNENAGVIVSGGHIVSGGASPDATMNAAQGVPVILPSNPNHSNMRGAFVNEAGPAGVAAALESALSGLQDECVNIADAFVTGNNTVVGKLVAGTPPSGRICSTTTFTYTMRYGPYGDCLPRKSINAATFQTVDTATRGSSQADVAIRVEGCANPSGLKFTPVKATTSARGGYSWAVSKRANQDQLALGQDASATVTYTVDFKRTGAKSGATLNAEVSVANPASYPITIEGATYTANSVCDGQTKTTSGPANCDSSTVPPKGTITCQIAGAVPCASTGAYTLVLTAGGGFTVASNPTPFAFNTQALSAQNIGSQCTDVKDGFVTGTNLVDGVVVSGERPSSKVCASQSFTYTVKYGPFSKCGAFKVSWGSEGEDATIKLTCESVGHKRTPGCCLSTVPQSHTTTTTTTGNRHAHTALQCHCHRDPAHQRVGLQSVHGSGACR